MKWTQQLSLCLSLSFKVMAAGSAFVLAPFRLGLWKEARHYHFPSAPTLTATSLLSSRAPAEEHNKIHYEILERIQPNKGKAAEVLLPKLLLEQCPGRFRSMSQAKKACKYGKILILTTALPPHRCRQEQSQSPNHHNLPLEVLLNETISEKQELVVGAASYRVTSSDEVWVCGRVIISHAPCCYPEHATKYMMPPSGIENVKVIYESNDFAVINKPENLTTIGEDRKDLQSMLGFLLRPPSTTDTKKPPSEKQIYLPRPVHRLDRRTSGLILVAKSKQSMQYFSKAFADRRVSKIYSALVFAGNNTTSLSLLNSSAWATIDYPIDGKESVSEWRTTNVRQDGSMALLQVKPHTGRTHQIRRHLSYCASMPIVGDSKYDNGMRSLRTNGMYLCCHSLDFPFHDKECDIGIVHQSKKDGNVEVYSSVDGSEKRMNVAIPLPCKFEDRLEQQT